MKHKIQGFVIWEKKEYSPAPRIWFSETDVTKHNKKYEGGYSVYGNCVTVGPCEIEVEVPDDFDPRAPMIETLRAQKQNVIATMTAKVALIDHEIGKLLALESKVTV